MFLKRCFFILQANRPIDEWKRRRYKKSSHSTTKGEFLSENIRSEIWFVYFLDLYIYVYMTRIKEKLCKIFYSYPSNVKWRVWPSTNCNRLRLFTSGGSNEFSPFPFLESLFAIIHHYSIQVMCQRGLSDLWWFFLFISRKCVFGRIRQIKADDMSHAIIWANYSPPDDIKNSLSRPDDVFCWRVEKCYGWRSYRSYRIFLGSQLLGEGGGV